MRTIKLLARGQSVADGLSRVGYNAFSFIRRPGEREQITLLASRWLNGAALGDVLPSSPKIGVSFSGESAVLTLEPEYLFGEVLVTVQSSSGNVIVISINAAPIDDIDGS